jgi:hypothetical protein
MGESACIIEEFHRRLREALAAMSPPDLKQASAIARRLAREMQFSSDLEEECVAQVRTLIGDDPV